MKWQNAHSRSGLPLSPCIAHTVSFHSVVFSPSPQNWFQKDNDNKNRRGKVYAFFPYLPLSIFYLFTDNQNQQPERMRADACGSNFQSHQNLTGSHQIRYASKFGLISSIFLFFSVLWVDVHSVASQRVLLPTQTDMRGKPILSCYLFVLLQCYLKRKHFRCNKMHKFGLPGLHVCKRTHFPLSNLL